MGTPRFHVRHVTGLSCFQSIATLFSLQLLWVLIFFCGCDQGAAPPASGPGTAPPSTAPGPGVPAGTTVVAPPNDAWKTEEIKRLEFFGARIPRGVPGQPAPTNETITGLHLSVTQFPPSEVALLRKLPNLEQLSLPALGYTDASIDVLVELRKLKSLDLGGNPITDAGVGQLAANLPDLEKVVLTGTNISDNAVKLLTSCSKIKWLSVEATGTTDRCIEHLKKMENLNYFIYGRTKITEAGIAELQQALPNCKMWTK